MVFGASKVTLRRADHRIARFHRILSASLCALPLALAAPAFAGVLDHVTAFRIHPERLRQALLAFGRQAHLQVIFRGAQSARRVPGLSGRYTARQAVARLLKGTDLTYSVTDRTVEVYPISGSAARRGGASGRPAMATGTTGPIDRTPPVSSQSRRATTPPILQQVIVTGSHISGGPPPSEPIMSITARQIRESGYQSVEQLMASLPENLHSVGSEVNNLPTQNDAGNLANGSGVDLLGMGYDSTLVLVNGHRLAPAGINGAFTDISVIPLSMIKRIDVVTDGASAIYGSDAMGGVVNYILKDRQNGAATSVEYGSVTHGSLNDYRVSQSYGLNWNSGHALLAYEYHDETPLNASDRSYSVHYAPGQLTPSVLTNSIYLTGDESVGNRLSVNGAAFYSRRGDSVLVSGTTRVGSIAVTQYSYSLGAKVLLANRWSLRAHTSYGGNDSHSLSFEGLLAGDNRLFAGSLAASGPLLTMPAGPLKAAIGVQYRKNSLAAYFNGVYPEKEIHRSRTVDSAFVEGEIPLLGSAVGGAHGQKLSIDVAARLDHYSDFGSSTNPRVGIAWQPVRGLKLRGTLSRSFKAPNFYELYGATYTYLLNALQPTLPTDQTTTAIVRVGSNSGLTAERSTEWTAGFDFEPQNVNGLDAQVTFYDARFTRKIEGAIIPLSNTVDLESLYSAYILQNPSAAEIQQYISQSDQFLNLTVYPGFGPVRTAADATAIVDDRFQNVGASYVRGLITTLSYTHDVDGYRYSMGFNGSYIFEFVNQVTPGGASVSTIGIFGRPVNFRGRLSVGLRHSAWGINAFMNYVNRYRESTGSMQLPIASWTTVDVTASYRLFWGRKIWGNPLLNVSCVNCADRSPPAVSQLASFQLGYDGANANPLGRFITASVSVRW
ncbi:MAG: TonB-dependent receptor domain-containing protein [Steroidobacteraceae bacterium]